MPTHLCSDVASELVNAPLGMRFELINQARQQRSIEHRHFKDRQQDQPERAQQLVEQPHHDTRRNGVVAEAARSSVFSS